MNFESSLSKLFNILGSKYEMGNLTFPVIFPVCGPVLLERRVQWGSLGSVMELSMTTALESHCFGTVWGSDFF